MSGHYSSLQGQGKGRRQERQSAGMTRIDEIMDELLAQFSARFPQFRLVIEAAPTISGRVAMTRLHLRATRPEAFRSACGRDNCGTNYWRRFWSVSLM